MGTNQNSRTHKLSQATDNTINNSFRLIAIRPYADSSKETLKALHPDTTYFLVGDYIDKYKDGKWVDIEKSSEVGPLPHDFFSVKVLDENKQPLEMPFVNISAIVGKNGCGKSSLVEFLIQLINNFAIKQEFSSYQDFEYAGKAFGRVYYEMDNYLHYIDCSYSWEEENEIQVKYSDTLTNIKRKFFYSIISNYSLYAYNSKDNNDDDDDDDDDKVWLDNLFHKNDSYQMPIVITPMRHEGNIDINVETNLAELRLLSIYSQAENFSGRNISGEKYATGVAMSLNSSSKLSSYIKNKFNDDQSKNGVFDSKITHLKNLIHKKNAESSLNTDMFDGDIQFWSKFNENIWRKYHCLIDYANSITKDLLPENKDYGQIYVYLDLLLKIPKLRNLDSNNTVTKSIKVLMKHCQFLNALQFQRLMMIIYVSELWNNKAIFSDRALILAFSKLKNEDAGTKAQAYLYLIYKTISIFETYEPYCKTLDFSINGFTLFDRKSKDSINFFENLDECFKNLFDGNGKIKVNP